MRRRAEVLNDLSFSAVSVSFSLAFFDASRVALARAFEQSRILHGRQTTARSSVDQDLPVVQPHEEDGGGDADQRGDDASDDHLHDVDLEHVVLGLVLHAEDDDLHHERVHQDLNRLRAREAERAAEEEAGEQRVVHLEREPQPLVPPVDVLVPPPRHHDLVLLPADGGPSLVFPLLALGARRLQPRHRRHHVRLADRLAAQRAEHTAGHGAGRAAPAAAGAETGADGSPSGDVLRGGVRPLPAHRRRRQLRSRWPPTRRCSAASARRGARGPPPPSRAAVPAGRARGVRSLSPPPFPAAARRAPRRHATPLGSPSPPGARPSAA